MADSPKNPHTARMSKSRIYNTFRDDDNVTYQIMAYRQLNGDEAKKKVIGFLSNAKLKRRPHPGDVVIINTAIGLRTN